MAREPEPSWDDREDAFFADGDLVVEVWAQVRDMGRLGKLDRAPLPYMGVSATLHVAFLVLTLTLPPAVDFTREDFSRYAPRDRFVTLEPDPPPRPPAPPPTLEHAMRGDGEDDGIGHKAAGAGGAAGASRAPERARRLSVKGDARRARVKKASAARATLDESVGALAAAGAVFSEVDESLGQDALDAMGQVVEERRGEARGVDGLGITGVERGGEGRDEGFGVSELLATPTARRGQRGVLDRRGAIGEARQMDVRLSEGEGEEVGCLSPRIVRDAVRRRVAQVRACYERGLVYDHDLSGRVSVELEIAPEGHIADLTVRDDSLGSQRVVSCIEEQLDSLTFPSFEGCASVTVRYPFRFSEASR
jgi:hypothetical protein